MYHYLAWDLLADQQHLSLPICFPVYTQSHIPDSKLGVEELKTPAHPTPSHACGTAGTSCLSSHSLWYFSLGSQDDTAQCCAHIPNHFQRISDHGDTLHIFMPVTPLLYGKLQDGPGSGFPYSQVLFMAEKRRDDV